MAGLIFSYLNHAQSFLTWCHFSISYLGLLKFDEIYPNLVSFLRPNMVYEISEVSLQMSSFQFKTHYLYHTCYFQSTMRLLEKHGRGLSKQSSCPLWVHSLVSITSNYCCKTILSWWWESFIWCTHKEWGTMSSFDVAVAFEVANERCTGIRSTVRGRWIKDNLHHT